MASKPSTPHAHTNASEERESGQPLAENPQPQTIGFGTVVKREIGGVLVILVLAAALTLTTSTFLTPTNLANLVRQVTVFAVLAVGQLFVILTSGIDLSVGSILGLSGAVTALLLVAGMPVPLAVLIGLVAGLASGFVNGLLVAFTKLPPFIATLGMLGITRGLVLLMTDAETISPLPESFNAIANGSLLGLPNLLWILVLAGIIATFVLSKTVFGRYVYAVGSNQESARLAGVPVHAVLIAVYSISGLLAGFAGILTASRLGAGIPTAGDGYELQAIAGAVIGGASLSGAKGRAVGAILGAFIMGMLDNGGNLLGVNSFYQQIAIGALILLAVYFDRLQGRRFNLEGRAS
ncbi:ABC transporter permease [Thermogemmatispora carboxidivorans]|uniref:ABC transporter permease n=1 Tax=Thermogemmatispora carboxidivorans TaxID=1382306 RepID=UPI00069C4A50|nr:ABC transporter permease [Thermogemmatispora carboxidivorans]